MTDIVERLQRVLTVSQFPSITDLACQMSKERLEAADEIERLRSALSYYASETNWDVTYSDACVLKDNGRIARAALGEGK